MILGRMVGWTFMTSELEGFSEGEFWCTVLFYSHDGIEWWITKRRAMVFFI